MVANHKKWLNMVTNHKTWLMAPAPATLLARLGTTGLAGNVHRCWNFVRRYDDAVPQTTTSLLAMLRNEITSSLDHGNGIGSAAHNDAMAGSSSTFLSLFMLYCPLSIHNPMAFVVVVVMVMLLLLLMLILSSYELLSLLIYNRFIVVLLWSL